jgi:hypothetical protein
MTRQVGARVGAMLGARDKTVRFLGYGVYQGDEVPPENIGGFNMGFPNPKIVLDSGKVVWGCECWWGAEDGMKTKIENWLKAGYEIVEVDIDEARAEADKPSCAAS